MEAWDGGPGRDPVLPKKAGLNRFVWNMRYPTIPGVPGVYLEASYNGHKAIPGTYRFTLKSGSQTAVTQADILPNPLYSTTAAAYRDYHEVMSGMERELTAIHNLVNDLHGKQTQLAALLASLPTGDKFAAFKRDGEALLTKLKAWDDDIGAAQGARV